ncbi:hypothetical protein QOT17_009065 [Balamuthia mandrillaris]
MNGRETGGWVAAQKTGSKKEAIAERRHMRNSLGRCRGLTVEQHSSASSADETGSSSSSGEGGEKRGMRRQHRENEQVIQVHNREEFEEEEDVISGSSEDEKPAKQTKVGGEEDEEAQQKHIARRTRGSSVVRRDTLVLLKDGQDVEFCRTTKTFWNQQRLTLECWFRRQPYHPGNLLQLVVEVDNQHNKREVHSLTAHIEARKAGESKYWQVENSRKEYHATEQQSGKFPVLGGQKYEGKLVFVVPEKESLSRSVVHSEREKEMQNWEVKIQQALSGSSGGTKTRRPKQASNNGSSSASSTPSSSSEKKENKKMGDWEAMLKGSFAPPFLDNVKEEKQTEEKGRVKDSSSSASATSSSSSDKKEKRKMENWEAMLKGSFAPPFMDTVKEEKQREEKGRVKDSSSSASSTPASSSDKKENKKLEDWEAMLKDSFSPPFLDKVKEEKQREEKGRVWALVVTIAFKKKFGASTVRAMLPLDIVVPDEENVS